MYILEREKQSITIEGVNYSRNNFLSNNIPDFASKSNFHKSLYLFLKDWFSSSPLIEVQTSGSTGTPKKMLVEKTRMMNSAQLTCSFLDLKKDDTTLLCMSLDYIAGKMIVVRSLIAQLDLHLISPSGNPLRETSIPFKFAAMIPMQVYNSLQNEDEKQKLANIHTLIIGGGVVDQQMREELQDFPHNAYSTYGMTETLSHIALQRINGKEASKNYQPFENVNLSLSEEGTLIIDAASVSDKILYTNDVVEINEDKSFRIIGRKDNIINSGGVKIQIEEVERLLAPYIQTPFAISSLPNTKFGEIVVLVIENQDFPKISFQSILPPYSIPKKTLKISKIPLTETGKIARKLLKEMLWDKYHK